jgi:hypothetical protein
MPQRVIYLCHVGLWDTGVWTEASSLMVVVVVRVLYCEIIICEPQGCGFEI